MSTTQGERQQNERQTLTVATNSPDNTLVAFVGEYSEVDSRGALAFRLCVSGAEDVDFDPGGKSRGGKWIWGISHQYELPIDASGLEVRVQADKLCWSDRSKVYSTSNDWKDMTFRSKTAKKLVITREQLQEHVVVFGVWHGAAKGDERIDRQQEICVTLKLKNIYDEDDEDDDNDEAPFLSGMVSFFMSMVLSDASDSSVRTIAFPQRDVNCKATTRHVL